jgi:chain length determinant protein EpsF
MLPKQYSATASVVLDIKPDPIAGALYPGLMAPSYMATQVDIISSDRVAQRVVKNLKLADNPQVRQQWLTATEGKGSLELWLAETFQKAMDVKPSRESNVINVSYKAPDARFAAAMANAFMQAYVDTTLDMKVDPAKQYSSFFNSRVKEARDTLEKAQSSLSAFQREKSIIANDERFDVENSRLNELSSQLVGMQALSAESISRNAQAQLPSSDRMQEVLGNPVIMGMKADLARSEAKLQEFNQRFGEAHPQVQELKASIADMKSRLAAETAKVTSGVGISNTITRSRENQVRAELEVQRAKVLRMKQVRDQGSVLQRDIENAQRAYDAVLTRLTQTSLESQTTTSNVYILSQAYAPEQPSSPKVFLNSALSVLIGALLAIGAALALELLDRRVRGVDDIITAVGLPILGVLPRQLGKRGAKRQRIPSLQHRLVGGLPAPGKRN